LAFSFFFLFHFPKGSVGKVGWVVWLVGREGGMGEDGLFFFFFWLDLGRPLDVIVAPRAALARYGTSLIPLSPACLFCFFCPAFLFSLPFSFFFSLPRRLRFVSGLASLSSDLLPTKIRDEEEKLETFQTAGRLLIGLTVSSPFSPSACLSAASALRLRIPSSHGTGWMSYQESLSPLS
jgi:hypothetical protein